MCWMVRAPANWWCQWEFDSPKQHFLNPDTSFSFSLSMSSPRHAFPTGKGKSWRRVGKAWRRFAILQSCNLKGVLCCASEVHVLCCKAVIGNVGCAAQVLFGWTRLGKCFGLAHCHDNATPGHKARGHVRGTSWGGVRGWRRCSAASSLLVRASSRIVSIRLMSYNPSPSVLKCGSWFQHSMYLFIKVLQKVLKKLQPPHKSNYEISTVSFIKL